MPSTPSTAQHPTGKAASGRARIALVASSAFTDPIGWFTAWADRAGATAVHLGVPTPIRLMDLVNRADTAAHLASFDAAIVLCDASDPTGAVLRAAAQAREAGVCVIVLRRACSPEDHRRLAMSSLEVHDAATDPRFVAGLICGLVRSREALRDLEAELDLAGRSGRQAEQWLRRADDEMRLAARLQHDMLPRTLPAVGGLEFAAFFRSAYYVGGDVYRLWRLDEHRVGVFVADAMGHGLRAAMQSMILAHALVLKETSEQGYRLVSPARAMTRLNGELFREHHEIPRFATAVCAVMDSSSGQVTIASAGHPAPVLIGESASCPCNEGGPALGAFDQAEFPEIHFTLAPGETLVLHTDGLDAAINAAAGRDPLAGAGSAPGQVASMLGLPCASPLADCMEALRSRLDRLAGSLSAPDDIAVVAVRRIK